MKIITWNVNGIRATLGKNAMDWAFNQNPDALCLQEVKARAEQLDEEQCAMLKLPFVWNSAQRPGYSDVTTFFNVGLTRSSWAWVSRNLMQRDASFRRPGLVCAFSIFTSRMANVDMNA